VRVARWGGARTPVVLLHGLQSHSAWFTGSLTFLAEQGHPAYAFDRRGSGLSASERGHCGSYRELLAEVGTVIDFAAPGGEAVHLIGHCHGAIVAAAFACVFPERVASLTLSTPAIFTRVTLPLTDKLKVLWAAATGRTVRVPVPLAPELFSDIEAFVRFVGEDELAVREATGSLYLETVRARRLVQRNVDALTMPVFLATAGADRICDNARMVELFERMPSPRKRHRSYPNARHILELSADRAAYLDDLGGWLRAHADGRTAARSECA
jgi:alpha-beta hydrolase superfamily lysophospholipase